MIFLCQIHWICLYAVFITKMLNDQLKIEWYVLSIRRFIILRLMITSNNHNIDRNKVIAKDIGMFVKGCPPTIARIALNNVVNRFCPGALSKITPFT